MRLIDGELVADGGDVELFLGVQLSLQSAVKDTDAPFCVKGTYSALADVPIDEQTCPGEPASGIWSNRLLLSSAVAHTNEESQYIGLSGLVRSGARDALYRLRILGDSVTLHDGSLGTATTTFEYEPVP